MPLTDAGRFAIAVTQFNKGRAFIGAAHLLNEHVKQESHRYVYLHLICQGAELIFKGMLLLKNFSQYRHQEKKFGHKFIKIASTVHSEYNLKPIREDVREELEYIESLFSSHQLRYAGINEIFINPSTIKHEKALRYIIRILRLANRHFRKSPYARVA